MEPADRRARHIVAACFLGWALDAFDFFIMVFVFSDVAREFGVGITSVTWAVTVTLATRAVGALIFGRLADRYGRRPVLMASIFSYSVLEFASGFAPSLIVFILLRGLFGIAMGGEWGIGASLTMESIPARWRGPVSGMLQAGYPTGYLLATLLYLFAYPYVGWRGMFMLGAAPALLVLYIRRSVPESPEWLSRTEGAHRASLVEVLRRNVGLSVYAVVLMMGFNFYSHGTQDLYPNAFLKVQHGFDPQTVSAITIVYNVGAMCGGVLFGTLSQRIGRRAGIMTACLLSLPVLPLWAFGSTPVMLGLGAFLMQVCVQGAWGIVPAHLNELSPAEIRATFPGVVYQAGNFLASANATIQSSIADALGHDYRWPLAGTAGLVALLITLMVAFGREARDVRMGAERVAAE
jgi:SHS family lactate transporter-like MFS transporter